MEVMATVLLVTFAGDGDSGRGCNVRLSREAIVESFVFPGFNTNRSSICIDNSRYCK